MAMQHARLSLPAMRQTTNCDHLTKCTSHTFERIRRRFGRLFIHVYAQNIRRRPAHTKVRVLPRFPLRAFLHILNLPAQWSDWSAQTLNLPSMSTANQTNGSAAGKKCQIPASAPITKTKKPKPQYTLAQAPQKQAVETYFFCSSSYTDKLCV
jgi:hypothetical protein